MTTMSSIVSIVYATETGTAQTLAEKLFVRLKSRRQAGSPVQLEVSSIEDLADEWLEQPETSVVIFIVATSGEGEVPSTMKKFWGKLLLAQLPKDFLSDAAKFAVFGLGDSSYEKFNAAARKFRARLIQLGGNELCTSAAGDDQTDTELSFDRWVNDMLVPALKALHQNTWSDTESIELEEDRYKLEFCEDGSVSEDTRRGHDMPILKNERITAIGWSQDVRHIEMACSHPYQPGDVLNIWPKNNKAVIDDFLRTKYPDIDPNAPFACSPPHPFLPSLVTAKQVLCNFLDMNGVPTRFFFQQCSFYCKDEEDRQKMLEMASSNPEDATSYITYCKRERRTYVEVLKDFTSCLLPFSMLLRLVPQIRPRGYSISSSCTTHQGTIHITVALVRYITPYKRVKVGTCSSYLEELNPNQESSSIRAFVTSGSLKLPADPQTPLVVVATGTGCAPMRSLLYERSLLTKAYPTRAVRFYFGCRNSTTDYLYKNEWPQLCDAVCIAFSKEDRRRVPELLARDSAIVYDQLIRKGGHLYISGSAKRMPADIRETITQMLCKEGQVSRDEAVKMIRQLERERRYVVEAWS